MLALMRVRQAARLQFEVGTGELAPDPRFEPHGYVVVVNLTGMLEGQTDGGRPRTG
jgi:hypothetical protein